MAGILTHEQKQLAFRLRARGWRLVDIAREIGCTAPMVGLMVRDGRYHTGVPDKWEPRPGCLSIADREEILVGIRAGESLSSIARRLGRVAVDGHPGGRRQRRPGRLLGLGSSSACRGSGAAAEAVQAPRGRLLDEVSRRLEELWSPQEIARRLRLDFPDDPEMRVSHETIYQSLFVQGRGELRRELARCLRSGRAFRKKRGTVERRGRIPGWSTSPSAPPRSRTERCPATGRATSSSARAAAAPSARSSSAPPGSCCCSTSSDGRAAVSVEAAMRKAIATLPDELRQSITWDQGAEMANHASFTIATGIPIYFCDPHAPWQRGSNENTNGLLRQYLPKGTDLSKHTADELVEIQRSLNGRPRKTLGYLTPSEVYAQVVASTA